MLQIALLGTTHGDGDAGSWSRRLMCGGLVAQESEAD
jgi:hypothetical protein